MIAQLRVFDPTGATYAGVLPHEGLQFSFEVGGSGTLTFNALKADLDAFDAWDSVVILDLGEPGDWTPAAIYALRPPWRRAKVGGYVPPATWTDPDVTWTDPDWDWVGRPIDPEPQAQLIACEARGLLEVWAGETVVLPEYTVGIMPRGAGDERGLGWMSSAYDPTTDPREDWDLCYESSRATFPDGFPTASGAVWISAHADLTDPEFKITERKLFRATVTIPGGAPVLVRCWTASDEGGTLWVAGEPVQTTDYVEEGKKYTQVADLVMWPGTYAVGYDCSTSVTVGGDGVDPIVVAMAILDSAGEPDTWILTSSDTSFVACRRNDEPPGNEPPGPTPGAIVLYMLGEAQERGATGWAGVTVDFTALVDSYGEPWPSIVVERQVRYAHDSYWAVWQLLAETGEVDLWLTPDRVLHAAPHQGATLPLVLTEEHITTMADGQAAHPGTWVAAVAHDGWVDRSVYGPRREFGLELGTAISRPIADRVTAAALATRGRWDASCSLLPAAGVMPGIDYTAGDTLTAAYADVYRPARVLSLSATAGEGGLLWQAELTDGGQ